MPQMIKDIGLTQILGYILMASVSVNTWFVKEEITALRRDLKEIQVSQAKADANYAALKAEFQTYVRYAKDGR